MDYLTEQSYVIKRDGRKEKVHFDKITARIENLLSQEELPKIDVINIVQKTINSIKPGITTEELDLESAKICANLATKDYLYSILAGRILVSNLHKKTSNKFSDKMIRINIDSAETGRKLLDEKFVEFVNLNSDYLDSIVDYTRDFNYDIFAFKTLERAYLIKNQKTGMIYERPQDMFLRVATFLNMNSALHNIKKTYDLMSLGNYTHASPTLFNSATSRSQLSSCFLIATEDSMDGITKNWSDVSQISKWGGGIGLHISNVRAYGSLIRGTNGPSSGIIPMLKVYNEIARYVNQCFVGTTKIYTKNGLVPINQLNVGDEVFTNDGTLKPILKIYNDKYENNVLDINVMDNIISVTPEHPFYVIKNQNNIINKLERDLVVHEWLEAKYLTENDYITIPIPKYEKDYILYNDADCYMYGIMLNYSSFEKNVYSIDLLRNKILEFIRNYLKLNLIDFMESENKIIWPLSSKFKFNKNQLYINNVRRFDSVMLNLPLNKAKWIIKALLDNYKVDKNNVIINLSSNIVDAVKYLLLRMGVLTNSSLVDENTVELRIPKTKEIAELLNIEETNYVNFIKFFRFGDNLYTRIESINERQISDVVYDLEIEKNHNYLIEIGLVHNGGKRKGSIAIYLEPHHSDITEFLELRKNFGAETERARDLFLALWIPDLFMKQVENDGDWYLMCPDECPNLNDVYGEEYEKLYWKYVEENKYRKKIKAKDLMKQIMDSQLETGTPYIAYKDHCNRKSNQNNLGTIKSSNLCIEIVEYSDKNETAVCNLASIAINSCLEPFKMQGKFVIYTKKDCKYCNWAKLYMKNKNWDFEEIEDELGVMSKARLNTEGKITMPQIWYELGKVGGGEEYVGGFEDMLVFTADEYNYNKLYDIAYTATRNLDSVIDLNYYPTVETKRSNMKHRPIGLGIQGLADTLARMRIPFESDRAVEFNKKYMEYIYKASVQASSDMAKERYEDCKKLVEYSNKHNIIIPEFYDENYKLTDDEYDSLYHKLRLNLHESKLTKQFGAYSSYESSLVSKGLLQFDLWEEKPILDWGELRKQINQYGIRNSLLTALMPTASTSQILGNNECFEAMTSNMYTRRTLAGDFPLVNKYMMEDFKNIGIWTNDVKDNIIGNNGSVINLNIPNLLKDLYKTIWEIKQIWVLKQARARGPYVDQSQSMNIFMETPNYKKLYSSHLWAWKNGLKTGIYYLRSKPSSTAIKFSLDAKYDNCESCSA
ncbi:putative ribonucleotide reductase large subunit precursor [Chlorella virus XW01]|nr:putative ribonucleotide reductase large subunit precursor [Chlorella virus XW01]